LYPPLGAAADTKYPYPMIRRIEKREKKNFLRFILVPVYHFLKKNVKKNPS
jgi:hypothetical protein